MRFLNIRKWTPSALALALFARALPAQDIASLPALTPAELAMTDNPKQPGAPAAILYYAVDTDNQKSTETHSMRIKVFRDKGKEYANVEIPYLERYSQIDEIQGRTVAADGKVTPFDQQVFDREIVHAGRFRYHARIFTLPNVQIGSIIEYTYRTHYKEKIPDQYQHPGEYIFERGFTYPAADWEVQHDLYLIHGRYTLLPVKGASVYHFGIGIRGDRPGGPGPDLLGGGGPGRDIFRRSDGRIQYDATDIPAFEEEEYAVPEADRRTRLYLYYAAGFYSPVYYWDSLAHERAKDYDKFIGVKRSKVIDAEVARLVSPNDTAEAKLRKLYDRAQQIRDVNSELSKTEKETKRENLKENHNAQDVLEHGYAFTNEINLLFIAMARSAGFTAAPVLVRSRKSGLFREDYPNHEQLNAMVVMVVLDHKGVFFDPATRFCPYGLLPWDETSAGGIRLWPSGPSIGFTPDPKSTEAVTRTEGSLKLSEQGELTGVLHVTYEGQEALAERLWAMSLDESERREELEDAFKKRFAQTATVKLSGSDGWDKTGTPLRLDYEISIPSYAASAGRRTIVPLGVLHTTDINPFSSPRRVSPIYFNYPSETYEDIRVELPAQLQTDALPEDRKVNLGAVKYEFTVKKDAGMLEIKRARQVQTVLVGANEYQTLRNYFTQVLSGDSQQITLSPPAATAAAPKP
jgi:hypothetical protein